MVRTSVPSIPALPSRLGRLTATERRVWQAFPRGESVDLQGGAPEVVDPAGAERWPAERTVRGEVIAALLLGACPAAVGAVAAVRITGARISGELRVDHGQVRSLLQLKECWFDGPIDLDDAITESIDLSGSRLTTLSAYGAHVRGTLDLRNTVVAGEGGQAVNADGLRVEGSLFANRTDVTGSFSLIGAQISGRLTFIDATLKNRAPDGLSLNGGGMTVGRSLLAQGLETEGELRLPGAHIGSSLLLNGATLNGLGRSALHGDALTVASEATFRPRRKKAEQPKGTEETEEAPKGAEEKGELKSFEAVGSVRLPGARFGSDLIFDGAQLTPSAGQPALQATRMSVEGSLRLDGKFHTDGEIQLTGARITGHLELSGMASPNAQLTLNAATVEGGIGDDLASWPNRLHLDGFTYGPFSKYVEAEGRLPLLARQVRKSDDQVGGFRAQPYEQLAAYYRSLGNDGEARTVLLAKQRALRAKLKWWRRIPGHLLDLLVGYGYRPLRAIGWASGLLAASSAYFSQVQPQHVSAEDSSVFNPILYAADHLIPVIRFGQPEVWQYHGVPAVVTTVLTVLGWTLGIAIAAAASRTLTRN